MPNVKGLMVNLGRNLKGNSTVSFAAASANVDDNYFFLYFSLLNFRIIYDVCLRPLSILLYADINIKLGIVFFYCN